MIIIVNDIEAHKVNNAMDSDSQNLEVSLFYSKYSYYINTNTNTNTNT